MPGWRARGDSSPGEPRGWRLRRVLRHARRWRRTPAEYHQAEVAGYRFHWVEAGEGIPVVLLHGLCGSSRWWSANLPHLAERFRVLAVDLVGFGRSRRPGPLPGLAALADLTAAWMAQAGASPAHLVGHSMGGHLAIHLAARHPGSVRRLVLVDAAGLHRPLSPRELARWMYEIAPPRRWGDPSFLPVIWSDSWRAGPITAVRALRGIVSDDVSPLLPRIAAPTLVVWGQGDSVIPPIHGERMRDAIPGARLLILSEAYHNPMVDRPEAFNQAVGGFLEAE